MSILIGNWCYWIWCFKPKSVNVLKPTDSIEYEQAKNTPTRLVFSSLKFCFGNKHSNTPLYPSCVSRCIFAVPISHHAHNFHPFCIEITIYFVHSGRLLVLQCIRYVRLLPFALTITTAVC